VFGDLLIVEERGLLWLGKRSGRTLGEEGGFGDKRREKKRENFWGVFGGKICVENVIFKRMAFFVS
jgi:hypothetical protein